MNHLLILLTVSLLLCVLLICFLSNKNCDSINQKIETIKSKVKTNLKSSEDQTLSSALANVSIQISSYLGYDPSGGNNPYNSANFVQYVNDSLQLLQQAQSSGSLNSQFIQYIGQLLNTVKEFTPLEKSSIDEQEMGILAGQLYMCCQALTNGISWQGQSSDIIQDATHAIDTYQSWLAGSMTSAQAATYMNDPVIYNLKLDTDEGYPSSVVSSLPIDLAEVDAWYWSNNNANKARVWYDLGQFIGFTCIYTADGNTCLGGR